MGFKQEELERRIRIQTFTVPNSVGRLPINIMSTVLVYSAVVLKGLLPGENYQHWLLFVRACSILSERIVQKQDLVTADMLLLYGHDKCTPNLHLHLHIKECLLDFGPSHSFWCFSFERYNGILGSFHTNMKRI